MSAKLAIAILLTLTGCAHVTITRGGTAPNSPLASGWVVTDGYRVSVSPGLYDRVEWSDSHFHK